MFLCFYGYVALPDHCSHFYRCHTSYKIVYKMPIEKLNTKTEPVINITDLKNEAKRLRAEIIEIRMEIAEIKEILLLREQEIRSKQRGKTERKFI